MGSCCLVVALGGLAREKATGVALFSLGLPVSRLRLFLSRAVVAWGESMVLGLTSAILIPLLSSLVGEAYPFSQALLFGVWMSVAGLVILAFGLLISELFEGEFTAPVVGLCTLTAIFLGYRSHTLRGWNVFDVMSATASIDPNTQLLSAHSIGLISPSASYAPLSWFLPLAWCSRRATFSPDKHWNSYPRQPIRLGPTIGVRATLG